MTDYNEYIKEKKRKYGENWKDHISYGEKKYSKSKIKRERPQKLEGGGIASGMRRFNRGGKVK